MTISRSCGAIVFRNLADWVTLPAAPPRLHRHLKKSSMGVEAAGTSAYTSLGAD